MECKTVIIRRVIFLNKFSSSVKNVYGLRYLYEITYTACMVCPALEKIPSSPPVDVVKTEQNIAPGIDNSIHQSIQHQ